MATHQSPSGPLPPHQQHYPSAAVAQPNGVHIPPPPQQQQQQPQQQPPQAPQQAPPPPRPKTAAEHLAQVNESTWLQLGHLSEMMGELDGAMVAYERAMTFNRRSVQAMLAISCILRSKDQFTAAVEYLKQIIQVEPNDGEVWSSLGHCYLMMDDLQQAYSAYQQALYHLHDPREPKLWYGIGILYDRYGSLEHAEEAFSQVMRMDPRFEKANEIYFRLGIIYKQQQKFTQSLECFRYIVTDAPQPLSEEDIWFQIGHVHEQQKDYENAKIAYTRVLEKDPNHAKVLQQLGWLHHQQSSEQEQAIEYLEKSVAADGHDAQSWYLLGRCYMSQAKYPKAYEAYQQAVYRDGRNPTFWCSIGVLYYQINQYRDALDAYSRAIRLNPNISEVWYDLGTLYESCNNQTSDALDAYSRAADLDPTNQHIKARLALLKGQPTNGLPTQAVPHDVHPRAYQPDAMSGPPGPQWGSQPANAPPPGPMPPPLTAGNGWASNGIAEPQNPQMQPQPMNPFDQRDRHPPQQQQQQPHAAPLPARQPSPRQDLRYREPQRPPPPAHRGLSPSPKGQQSTPASYAAAPLHHQPPAHLAHAPGIPPYGAPAALPPPSATQTAPAAPVLPAYPRQPSPRPDIRPINHQPAPSPGSQYPRMAYDQPAPTSAPAAHHTEQPQERSGSAAPKRMREWEDDHNAVKKPQTEESRSRLDEIKMHRPSPPQKVATPPIHSPSEVRRLDEARPSSTYHPSEAAHHPPPALPSITQPSPPRNSAPPQEEARAQPPAHTPQPPAAYEPAARKMDMDENYDDSGDDEKKSATKQESARNSPKTVNGTAPAAAPAVEQKA
ncbi:hypothetical protein AMS68_002853 [Peltaster fructicola]|uniref:Uncharacterized protein n=1 Tax=Peltaster fructicola TaxID=286661 RepID=A0A6H0XRM1_9PEZI|nr:hypothetical protein AMS68_002853 [Peltaster fructicola]